LVFHAYIKEIHDSRSKTPSKKSRQAAGLNSGVKGLKSLTDYSFQKTYSFLRMLLTTPSVAKKIDK
jgi:hypothetical protein